MFDRRPAPELDVLAWINSEPLRLAEQRGRVVMIDFWSYSCINCIRTLPHMRRVWDKFRKYPFLMIGVHSPEFDFEKDLVNLTQAVKRHHLEYPIAVDSDFMTWKSYENHYWPAQYFIDRDGVIRHIHVGEGGELEIEAWIVRLLKEMGIEVELGHVSESLGLDNQRLSREIYCGALRNPGIGNDMECEALKACSYIDDQSHDPDVIYLQGSWFQDLQFLQHADTAIGHLSLRYQAREVYAVLASDAPMDVEVLLDDQPMSEGNAGQDIIFRDGRSWLHLDRNDMYYLVRSSELLGHELKMLVLAEGFRVYAFTFG
jgi:peroxiredoxin